MSRDGSTDTLGGRTCLVTGSTSGIGLETAVGLAELGALVIVTGRSPERCRAAARQVAERAPQGDVDWIAADLGRRDEVIRLARRVREAYPRLDVLVNNAGAVFARRRMSPDGVEATLAVNHLAPFLLTRELLPALRAAAPSRVVNVASVAHERARPEEIVPDTGGAYRPFVAYAATKLANVMFTYELARRLEGTGVTANAVDPGLVRTGIGAKAGLAARLVWGLTLRRHRERVLEPHEAARAVVRLAAEPELQGITGAYFKEGLPARSSPASLDPDLWARLWEASEQLVGARVAQAG